jgi:DNA gyrase subunit A
MKFQKEVKQQRKSIQNLINIESDDKVKAFICTQDLKDQDYINSHNLIMVTKKGQVKKTSLENILNQELMELLQLPLKKTMNY